MKTKKQEREERRNRGKGMDRYSTIDHHLDLTADGGFTVKQKAPFTGGFIGTELTPTAKAILEQAEKKDKPT